MTESDAAILAEIAKVAPALHMAGTFSAAALEAIARHASEMPVHHSAGTGSGVSTLLFSHVSAHHTVFALG